MHDEYERLIDQALTKYAQAEPLQGLPERILQRVETRRSRRHLAFWLWIPALAALVALLFISPKKPAQHTTSEPHLEVAVELRQPELNLSALAPKHKRHTSSPTPKLEVFPSSPPLTAEERVLLEMATRDPKNTIELFAYQNQMETK